jgi:hypothetical protein
VSYSLSGISDENIKVFPKEIYPSLGEKKYWQTFFCCSLLFFCIENEKKNIVFTRMLIVL